MRTILLLTLFVWTNFVNAQDIINLNDLAEKKVKSTPTFSISDNAIDFKGVVHAKGYWIKFTGTYSRSLHIKNFVGGDIIFECTITTNTSDKTLKFTDCRDWTINGEKAFLNGSGNNSGAMIWVTGKWQNCHLVGFRIDQKRNGLPVDTPNGGPAVQFESYSDPAFNHKNLIIEGTIVKNANDEAFYILKTRAIGGYLDTLIIRNTDVLNTGRDFWQATGIRKYLLIEDNIGANGGLERNGDHVSGFSLNEKNGNVIIRNNMVLNTPQFMFSGGGGTTLIENNTFQQELAPGGNQGLYLRDGDFILKGNWFNANNSARSVIGVDKAKVTWDVSNTFVGKQPFFVFTGGFTAEVPVITNETGILEIEKSTTGQKVFLLYNGQRIQIK